MNRPSDILAAISLSIATLTLVGCSSGDDGPSGMSVAKTCQETQCDARMSRDNAACSRCMSACFDAMTYYDCDPSRACRASCSDTGSSCSDAERESCIKQGFNIQLGSDEDAELKATCIRYFDHLTECSLRIQGVDKSVCSTWAKVYRPDVAKVFDCAIAQGCSGEIAACMPAKTTFGEELCTAMEATCGAAQCTPEVRDALDGAGGWLRDDVIEAGKSCATQATCKDANDCYEAWVSAARL